MTLPDTLVALAVCGLLPAFAFIGPLVAALGSRQEDYGLALGHQDLPVIRLRDQRARDKALMRNLKARLAATRAVRSRGASR